MRRTRALLGSGLLLVQGLAFGMFLTGCLVTPQAQAAKDFGCSEDRIRVENLGDNVSMADGCEKKDIYGYLPTTDRWVSLVERASFELSCKREELTITPLAPRQMGVSGCGAKRVYVLVDAGWVLDSGSSESPPPAAPATAAPAAPATAAPAAPSAAPAE
ncbi:MAG: hypothetical protein HOV80_19480 [Polyangiaceae bacterium]|nr:hypothetical protein [Polyangiaceae bacterium]